MVPALITTGPDGALWFAEFGASQIGRISTAGVITESAAPTAFSMPYGIVSGPDGALWFTENVGQIGRVSLTSAPAAFFNGEVSLGSGVYYLQFPDGNAFGYYNFPSFPILFHYDLGFEAFVDGGNGAAYLYDFASGHWWFTSPSLFPNLYDFTLNNWLYYLPATNNPGHYTSNPRYFSDLTTGTILSM